MMRKEVKSTVARMRVTESEIEAIKANARKYGFKNISEFMRAVCLHPDAFEIDDYEEANPLMEVQEK